MGGRRHYTAPHQIYCDTCGYGYQSLRPIYLGGAGNSTSNNAFKTGSNFPNQAAYLAAANTGVKNDQFSDGYFEVPNYADAITDGSVQFPQTSTTNFIPPPGIGRNSFPGPGYRDVDITIAKRFGFPNMRVLGDNANLEIKADMLNVFNITNINPDSISTNIQASNLGQASSGLGSRIVDFQARFSF